MQRLGRYPPPPGASDIPGLEVAGRVVRLGENVTTIAEGDAICALVAGGGYAEVPRRAGAAVPARADRVLDGRSRSHTGDVFHRLDQRLRTGPARRRRVPAGARRLQRNWDDCHPAGGGDGGARADDGGFGGEMRCRRSPRRRTRHQLQDRRLRAGRPRCDRGARRRRRTRHGGRRVFRAQPQGARRRRTSRPDCVPPRTTCGGGFDGRDAAPAVGDRIDPPAEDGPGKGRHRRRAAGPGLAAARSGQGATGDSRAVPAARRGQGPRLDGKRHTHRQDRPRRTLRIGAALEGAR